MITRERLDRHQVWGYLGAILAGLALGTLAPGAAPLLEAALWPALGLLLYATFTQVPLARLPDAFRDRRFLAAVLAGNFLIVPLFVWALLALAPADPPIRLGILMVLLVPCTDWFITFTHLSGGDTGRAVAATPALLLAQLALLPSCLWLFMGEGVVANIEVERVALAFVALIALPLLLAFLTGRWIEARPQRAAVTPALAWLPVPLLALVLVLIAGAQVQAVSGALPLLGQVLAVFALYLIGAAVIGAALARALALGPKSSRTLIFSLGTRNSFVVLPLALALPPAWQPAIVVIVFQSLVELFGMIGYLWAAPRFLAPARCSPHR